MTTKVYGASDDLVEFEGDIYGEVDAFGTDDRDKGVLVFFSDGTILEAKYGKMEMAIWELKVRCTGNLFKEVIPCMDEDAKPHSDVANFRDGLKWAYAAKEWEKVK